PVSAPVVASKPVSAPVADKVWRTEKGSTVSHTLERWISDEKCIPSGWHLFMLSDDYSVDSNWEFKGTLYTAIADFLDVYNKAKENMIIPAKYKTKLIVDIYESPQCVIQISELKKG
ncbi:hypothetical protein HLB28_12970, partial [Dickeya dadantii]|nr:hypothetical protein [Dickeya dadantii]